MKDIFVVQALRTPFGSFGGQLAEVEASEMGAAAIQGVLVKCGLAPEAVDEVIVGQVLTGGCGQAPARQAMRGAGIPDSTHALTINKVCGSGLKAIMLGADSIKVGNSQVVIAGGMENMSQAPYLLPKARTGYRMGNGQMLDLMILDGLQDPDSGRHMGELAEACIESLGLRREDLDRFAARSYELAQGAINKGLFAEEIVPVVTMGRKGKETITTDEEPFRGDPGKLSQLRPAFRKEGAVTAGNASSINDGAAMVLLTDADGLKRHGFEARARIVAMATASKHPNDFSEAPIDAITKACAQAGLNIADIDLFEINEAFASVPLLAINALNLPLEKVNVNGGACAIGHPIGASGGRLAGTIIAELHRRRQRYGLVTLCIGGGEAVAAIFERV